MDEMINAALPEGSEYSIIAVVDAALDELHTEFTNGKTRSLPIAELGALGSGVSSLIPSLQKITQSFSIETGGIYKLVNAEAGDVLKAAKDGNAWGALHKAGGGSKMAKLKEVDSVSATSTSTVPINPTTMMMAAALYSIEKHLDTIEELEKEILSFLEIEKESQIEADVKSLASILSNYKYNWNNSLYVSSNHKLLLDIQRSARSNMLSYQKRIKDVISSKRILVGQKKIDSLLEDLTKKFKYYRLSVFAYAMASLEEIMLSGNHDEAYISELRSDIEKCSLDYRQMFGDCSIYLEKLADASIEKNILKGIGIAGKTVGQVVGRVPVVNKGPVDEFLQEKGERLELNASHMKKNTIRTFAQLGDPGTRVFVDKIEDVNRIFNHTKEICFDDERIYYIESI